MLSAMWCGGLGFLLLAESGDTVVDALLSAVIDKDATAILADDELLVEADVELTLGGMWLKQPPHAPRWTDTTARPL